MKRYLKPDELEIFIGVTVVPEEALNDIAATDILPIVKDEEAKLVDEVAVSGYSIFVDNVFEIISAYDFEFLDEYQHTSGSFPYTSEYRWIARRQEIEDGNIPKLIKLRVSDHIQEFSKTRRAELAQEDKKQAQELKQPKTKQKQRYEMKEIVVQDLKCSTYEEALHEVEMMVRGWLEKKGIDLTDYGPAIW